MAKATYNRKDRFFKKAKQDHFAARSAYKLEEIDRRFKLIRRGARVVDLGASPGSWLQYLAQTVGTRGIAIGYDIVPVSVSAGANVRAFEADVFTLTPEAIREEAARMTGEPADRVRIDAVVSDMAPKLSGIRDADQARSIALAEKALSLAEALVSEDGFFVAKVFQGHGTDEFLSAVKAIFRDVRSLRPEATRAGSREVFVIGRGRAPRR